MTDFITGYYGTKHRIRNIPASDAASYGITVKKDKTGRNQLTETKPGALKAWSEAQKDSVWMSAHAKRHGHATKI